MKTLLTKHRLTLRFLLVDLQSFVQSFELVVSDDLRPSFQTLSQL